MMTSMDNSYANASGLTKFYCQSCGESFADNPTNAFPVSCATCGGSWWATWKPGQLSWPSNPSKTAAVQGIVHLYAFASASLPAVQIWNSTSTQGAR